MARTIHLLHRRFIWLIALFVCLLFSSCTTTETASQRFKAEKKQKDILGTILLQAKQEKKQKEKRNRIEEINLEKKRVQLNNDIKKYREIVRLNVSSEFNYKAWNALVSKYPECATGLKQGDVWALKMNVLKPEKTIVNSLGMKFVFIPPGTFLMGDQPDDEINKLHRVTLTQGFYMQTTEVTQGQWKAVMGRNPSYFNKCGDDCPVEQVSCYDIQKFIQRLNRKEGISVYRLPTEAEWEYVCRAGTRTDYASGNVYMGRKSGPKYDPILDTIGWYKGNSLNRTHSVAQKIPNAWGFYDMHGNVWECCQDSAMIYAKTDTYIDGIADPLCTRGSYRVVRGGCYRDPRFKCQSASRYTTELDCRVRIFGVRLVRTI